MCDAKCTGFHRLPALYKAAAVAVVILFVAAALPALAAQTCITSKDTQYVYSGTTTQQLDRTIESASTTCETLIDEAATNTPEFQQQRANDIADRNFAWFLLLICGAIFLGTSFLNLNRKK